MTTPPVCDYEGSDYRTRFWENQGRDYEDNVERIALRAMLPPHGRTLIEIGAGFGRLAAEYIGYDHVVLFDYSRSLLREAQEKWGHDPRFLFVAGDWYKMPFVAGLFEAMVQIRTIHHAADVPALFQQLRRISQPGAHYVLEFANKRNLKAMLRHALRRQDWSPYDERPIEFAALNFDFHPRWMRQQLQAAGFAPGAMRAVSHFRIPFLKRLVPTKLLAGVDGVIQPTGKWWQLTPSVFVHYRTAGQPPAQLPTHFFACPTDQPPLPTPTTDDATLTCPTCGREWRREKGLYDFKGD
ncbi:MAG: class I SAM-dependent methyltransferase [Chloroflexi bacterium]|nr:class I SAM-dependent methyltransferase [Chloroflexota bacterium]